MFNLQIGLNMLDISSFKEFTVCDIRNFSLYLTLFLRTKPENGQDSKETL